MTLPLSFYLVAAFCVFTTGLSKSGFGGGLGIMSVPLLSLFIAPQFAVVILMPVLLTMDVIIAWRYRHNWDRRVFFSLLPGALLGLALGAASYQWMDAQLIRFVIGVLALIFVAQFLWRKHAPVTFKPSYAMGFGLGAVSGFASFVAHAGGPPVKGLLLKQGLEKSLFVGTNTMFFFAMNAIKTVSYGAMGHFSWDSFQISLTIAPMLVVGILIGTKLHRFIDQRSFANIVYGFLALTGAKLLWDSSAFWLP